MRLPVRVTRTFGRSLLIIQKQSPNILFTAGVIGSVASMVLASRATLKLHETLDDIQKDINDAKNMKENIKGPSSRLDLVYTDGDYTRDMIYVYSKAGFRLIRLYGPSVLISAASITALTGSHVQLMRRNAALVAAYTAVQKAYDDYRDRVREALGEEKELDFYHARKVEEIENAEGKKEEVTTVDPNKWSPYAKIFDEYSDYWEKDAELNIIFVRCQQNYANDLLHSRGHIFLNEVYDMLGVERTKAGAVVGWVVGKDGDNFVDFGIYEAHNTGFVNGWERSVILDFNVDGVIYDKI